MVVARGWMEMGAESYCLMGMNFQSDGDGCTAMWMCLAPLKIVKMVNFMLCIVLHTQTAYDKARLRDEPWASESGKCEPDAQLSEWCGANTSWPLSASTFSSVMQAGMGARAGTDISGCRQEQSFHKHHLKSLSPSTARWVGIITFTLLKGKLRLREVCDSSKVTQLG